MASGFFQGGMAEGIQSANKMDLANRTLAADTDLRTRGLEIKERTLQRAERQDTLTRVDKAVSDTMATVNETIKAAVEAGRSPDQILKAVTPLVESAKALGAKAGRDPSLFDAQVKAWISQPGLIESAGIKGTSEGIKKATSAIAEARALEKAGFDSDDTAWKDPEKRVAAENSLRNSYLQQSKNFVTIRSYKQRMDSAPEGGVGDIALVFSYMKMLDPSSTVREGEYATAANAGGAFAKVGNLYNNLIRGDQLTPKVRKELRHAAQKFYQDEAAAQDKLATDYAKIAKRQKLRVDNVVIDLFPAKPRATDGASFSDRFEGVTPSGLKFKVVR